MLASGGQESHQPKPIWVRSSPLSTSSRRRLQELARILWSYSPQGPSSNLESQWWEGSRQQSPSQQDSRVSNEMDGRVSIVLGTILTQPAPPPTHTDCTQHCKQSLTHSREVVSSLPSFLPRLRNGEGGIITIPPMQPEGYLLDLNSRSRNYL